MAALRQSFTQLTKRASPLQISKYTATPVSSLRQPQHKQDPPGNRNYAAVVPPVTQDATGSKGPTAMVFMNMGGPSTTDEVGSFLSMLFVSAAEPVSSEAATDMS